jgi:hypothetical protein
VSTELATLADLAEILGAAFVIGGVVFAIIQIRQFRRQRLEIAAIELARSFQNAEFTRAHTFVLGLPDPIDASTLRAQSPEAESLAMVVSITFESVGVMVFHRVVPIQIVDELMGGTVRSCWHKLSPWIDEIRAEQQRPEMHEWFQWLADQLEKRAQAGVGAPAYEAQRDWKG